jgi:drug/metabolite transporter (DMT)-like permease
VLAYTMPLWAIPIGLGLSREVLSSGKRAGVTIGFAGLVLFMNTRSASARWPRQ